MSNSLERMFRPELLDILSPFVAFILVILLPVAFGIFVISRVLTGAYTGEDQD